MLCFSAADLEALDRLWRAVPADHVWTGWSACGETPEEITLYRTRAHWRRFPLQKSATGFCLFDDRGHKIAETETLEAMLAEVEGIPGLQD